MYVIGRRTLQASGRQGRQCLPLADWAVWWAQWLAESLRYVGLYKRALIRAKATTGSYINATGKFGKSRGAFVVS